MKSFATMLAGTDNTTSATIETRESSRESAAVIGYSLIIILLTKRSEAATVRASRPSLPVMRFPWTRSTVTPTQRTFRR